MEKIITPAYQISGKRKKLTGYIGELRDGETIISSLEYSTHADAEKALDALAFDILSDQFQHGLIDEPPPFDPSTCCFCSKPHAAQACPDMRALLFAPATPRCITCGDDGDCPDCGRCGTCKGEGRLPAYGYGDQAGGYAETCEDCKGKGVMPPLDVDFAPTGFEV